MPDVGDVVDHVQELAARLVVEDRPESPRDRQRRPVREGERRAEAAAPLDVQRGRVGSDGGEALRGDAQDEIGVGAERGPRLARAGRRDARKLAVAVEHVRDDLEVNVRRPVAVARRGAHGSDPRALRDGSPRGNAVDGFRREVTVQRVEHRRARRRVLQDDGRTVVEPRGVVARGVDASFERAHRRGSPARRTRRWRCAPCAARDARRRRPQRRPWRRADAPRRTGRFRRPRPRRASGRRAAPSSAPCRSPRPACRTRGSRRRGRRSPPGRGRRRRRVRAPSRALATTARPRRRGGRESGRTPHEGGTARREDESRASGRARPTPGPR